MTHFLKVSKNLRWSGTIETHRTTVCHLSYHRFLFSPQIVHFFAPSHLIIPDREVHFHDHPHTFLSNYSPLAPPTPFPVIAGVNMLIPFYELRPSRSPALTRVQQLLDRFLFFGIKNSALGVSCGWEFMQWKEWLISRGGWPKNRHLLGNVALEWAPPGWLSNGVRNHLWMKGGKIFWHWKCY